MICFTVYYFNPVKLQGVPQRSFHFVVFKLLKIVNIGKWIFNIPWIPWVISFSNYIELSFSSCSEISYGHKRKSDLELKLTFFNLNYEKSTQTHPTVFIFWANPAWELLSFLLPRDNTVQMQHFGSLNSFLGPSDLSLLNFQDERRWQESPKMPGFAGFLNTARVLA